MTSGLERHPPATLLAVNRRGTNQLVNEARALGVGKLGRNRLCQRIDAGMPGKEAVLELPYLAEAVVPRAQAAIRLEHANRLEEVVERRRADAQ